MDLSVLRDEVVWIVVLGVVLFYQLSHATTNTLLAMVVLGMFGYVAFLYLQRRSVAVQATKQNDVVFLEGEASQRREIASDRAFVATFPKKGLRYLRQSDALLSIAKNVVIARMFDKARYADMLLYMNHLQKVYMYILDGRYHPKDFLPIFHDLRESVLEVLYSMYFVVPKKLKHVYGVDPYSVLRESTQQFTVLTREMLNVLHNYAKKQCKQPYVPETLPKAADAPFDPHRARRLP
jgi:hypothetical protein